MTEAFLWLNALPSSSKEGIQGDKIVVSPSAYITELLLTPLRRAYSSDQKYNILYEASLDNVPGSAPPRVLEGTGRAQTPRSTPGFRVQGLRTLTIYKIHDMA